MNPGTASESGGDRLIPAITGDAPRSCRARDNLARALEGLGADMSPHEIDLLVDPEQSLTYGILATPALMHIKGGTSNGVLYGDLSDETRPTCFLKGLLEHG